MKVLIYKLLLIRDTYLNIMEKRRDFIKKVAAGSAGLAIGGTALGFGRDYSNIQGANDRIRVGIIGVNGRGNGMGRTFSMQPNTEVATVCDVDVRAIPKAIKTIVSSVPAPPAPKSEKDCRKVCEDKSIDAIYIATPDHWHAPLTIMGCQGGKHVYCEKPLSHNPAEGELAVAAARKYNRVVQMGAQRRSALNIRAGIEELHNGIIGRVYLAKTWYTNMRKETFLTPGNVPEWLDFELWQGPAPRATFKDNLVHYNWHWFWHWGTAETCNNGTHEIDCCRWFLGTDYPTKVTSSGGRYAFKDDWETPDTQVASFEFGNNKSISWEGRSCNVFPVEGAGRGFTIYGDKGTLVNHGNDDYQIFDYANKLVKEVKSNAGGGR